MISKIIFIICLLPLGLNCSPQYLYSRGNALEAGNMESNDIPPVNPHEPADNSLPKPMVPFFPSCTKFGYFRDPFNCGKFYWCNEKNSVPMAYYCRPGWAFSIVKNMCTNPKSVVC